MVRINTKRKIKYMKKNFYKKLVSIVIFLNICNFSYSQNIDELPFPDWDVIDHRAYQSGRAKHKREFLTADDSKNFSITKSLTAIC